MNGSRPGARSSAAKQALGEAAWSVLFLGVLLGEVLSRGCAPGADRPRISSREESVSLERWTARQWRALPGIGPALALSIQRGIWKWRRDSSRDDRDALWLTQIQGIGPAKAKRVRLEMERRGLSAGCPWTPVEEVELSCRHFDFLRTRSSAASAGISWQALPPGGVNSSRPRASSP